MLYKRKLDLRGGASSIGFDRECVRRVKAGEVDCFEPIVGNIQKQMHIFFAGCSSCKQDAQDAVRISSSKRSPSFIPMKRRYRSHHGYTRLPIIIVLICFAETSSHASEPTHQTGRLC